MQDFQKYLLLLSSNLRALSKTPLGYSFILHIFLLIIIFSNIDFNFKTNKLPPLNAVSISFVSTPLPEKNNTTKPIRQNNHNTPTKKTSIEKPKHSINDQFADAFAKMKRKKNIKKEIAQKIKNTNKKFDDLFDKTLLKNLAAKKATNKKPVQKIQSNENHDIMLTKIEEEEIRRQIIPNWLIPAGIKNAENITIEVLIEIAKDGTIIKTKILNNSNDKIFKIAAQSAIRALLMSSPLKITSPTLKNITEFIFKFDPKDAL